MAGLDNEQRKIVRLIKAEGRNIRSPRLRRVYERAAVQTGLVESGLHNLSYGDASSKGWRQEQATLYKNPTNLRASIRRFREEFQQQYQPGEKSYQVAAQVQRPREDLRGRYRDVAGQAAGILRGVGGTSGGAGSPAQGPMYRTVPGVNNAPARDELKRAYFQNSHDPNALLQLKAGLDQAQDTPSRRVRVRGSQPSVAQTGNAFVDAVTQEAQHIDAARVPYLYGGGHAGKQRRGSEVAPLDCSGAVSRVLGIDPRTSGQFESWGKPGKGRVTIYANDKHVLMEINGHFWGTSGTNPEGGPGWIKRKDIPTGYLKGFVARHAG